MYSSGSVFLLVLYFNFVLLLRWPVWQASGLGWQGGGSMASDFRIWLGDLYQHADKELFAQILLTLWAIWLGRNRWVFEGIRDEPYVTVGKAAMLWHDFSEAAVTQGNLTRSRPLIHWRPPQMGVYKINVDGALFKEHHCVGLGVIVRDWEGQVIAASSKKLSGTFPVAVVEAMAVRYALVLAHELGLHSVEVEGNSIEVVNVLNLSETFRTPPGLIIEDILTYASQFFDMASFGHIHREGNEVAHGLTHYASNIDDVCVWIEDIPEFIRDQFLVDLYQVPDS
ncbi:hypothetical protein L1049_024628 [Liquidambar formosana]|uniref:RNase H type-1 domain-containing protein n=1 Tax=Liquidambar formosana TaxID=63359 RepID=A0AAP0RV73_LIQFO